MPVDANKSALDASERFKRPDSHLRRETPLYDVPRRFWRYEGICTGQELRTGTRPKEKTGQSAPNQDMLG